MIPERVKCPDCKEPRSVVVRTRSQKRIVDLHWRCWACNHRLDASGIGKEEALEDLRRRWRKRFLS